MTSCSFTYIYIYTHILKTNPLKPLSHKIRRLLTNVQYRYSCIFCGILLFLLHSQQVLASYSFGLFWQQRLSVVSMARASKSKFISYIGFYHYTQVYFSLKRGWLFQITTIHLFRDIFPAPVTSHFSKWADTQCWRKVVYHKNQENDKGIIPCTHLTDKYVKSRFYSKNTMRKYVKKPSKQMYLGLIITCTLTHGNVLPKTEILWKHSPKELQMKL